MALDAGDTTAMTFDKVQTHLSKHAPLPFYCITELEYEKTSMSKPFLMRYTGLFFKSNVEIAIT